MEADFVEEIQGIIEGSKLDETIATIRGYCYLKQKNEEFRRHWLEMQGNELYFYTNESDRDHKFMHCLSGTYLKEVTD
jgi:hypothetical protein